MSHFLKFKHCKKFNFNFNFNIILILIISRVASANVSMFTSAILVDKKTNSLLITHYKNGQLEISKTYHATLGQVKGDKSEEGDLKTPEGIYTFHSSIRPPELPAKFGVIGFKMNFPNPFDKLAGLTGSNIMLHATNEPERLKRNFDSQGCVVVKNEEILEIKNSIRLGLTPILIFSELGSEFLKPGENVPLRNFFEGWVKSWENKDLQTYINHYHSDFSAQGKDKDAWKSYKSNLNKKYLKIKVQPEWVHYYRHPKYSMITFTQNYHSELVSGGTGHRSRGTKILYVAEETGVPKIIAETFTHLMW